MKLVSIEKILTCNYSAFRTLTVLSRAFHRWALQSLWCHWCWRRTIFLWCVSKKSNCYCFSWHIRGKTFLGSRVNWQTDCCMQELWFGCLLLQTTFRFQRDSCHWRRRHGVFDAISPGCVWCNITWGKLLQFLHSVLSHLLWGSMPIC